MTRAGELQGYFGEAVHSLRAEPNVIDVRNIGASLSINGDIEESGMARAVMGNPINAVAWLAIFSGGAIWRFRKDTARV